MAAASPCPPRAGMGDNNWWIAQIYTLPSAGGALKAVYKPPVERQIAEPRWTPDGKSILFIGGIMSDEGSTGGEIYRVDAAGGDATSITPGITSSVADITAPRKSKYIYFSEHFDGGSAVSQVDPATGQIERLWKGDETIFTMDGGGVSLSDDGKSTAVTRNSWQRAPEVWTGPVGDWRKLTHANEDRAAAVGRIEKPALEERRVHGAGLAHLPQEFRPGEEVPDGGERPRRPRVLDEARVAAGPDSTRRCSRSRAISCCCRIRAAATGKARSSPRPT